jgi:hypothetical protein
VQLAQERQAVPEVLGVAVKVKQRVPRPRVWQVEHREQRAVRRGHRVQARQVRAIRHGLRLEDQAVRRHAANQRHAAVNHDSSASTRPAAWRSAFISRP